MDLKAAFGWLSLPVPDAKAWWLLYTMVLGVFLGSWMGAWSLVDAMGVRAPWTFHAVNAAPCLIMAGVAVALLARRKKPAVGGAA